MRVTKGVTFVENLVYWLGNLFSFGALYIAKIIIKKAIQETVNDLNLNIFIDTKERSFRVTSAKPN